MRSSGLLLNICALPSRCGCGSLGFEAEGFIKFLSKAKQRYWQLNALDDGELRMPLSPISTNAGNYILIDENQLIEQGLLQSADKKCFEDNSQSIYTYKRTLLEKAYYNFFAQPNLSSFYTFCDDNKSWLDCYATYCTAKETNNKGWQYWSKPLSDATASAVKEFDTANEERIEFFRFEQYIFHTQWQDFKQKANQVGVQLIGVLPFYCNYDSADVWGNQCLFTLNSSIVARGQSHTTQLPPYDWKQLASTGYRWWINRIKAALTTYDLVVIQDADNFAECLFSPHGKNPFRRNKTVHNKPEEFFATLKSEVDVSRLIGDISYNSTHKAKSTAFTDTISVAQRAVTASLPPFAEATNCTAYLSNGDFPAQRWLTLLDSARKNKLKNTLATETTSNFQLSQLLLNKLFACNANRVIVSLQDLTEQSIADTPYTAHAKYLSASAAEYISSLTQGSHRAE